MNILNVNMSIGPIAGGGSGERTFQLSRALARAGHTCTILTTRVGLTPERRESLQDIRLVDLPCLNERFFIPRFSYPAIRGIVTGADVIHLISHWTFVNALVYGIARRHRKPYVVCPAGALPIFGRSKLIKALFNRMVGNAIIRNATGHIAITRDEIRQFAPYGVEASRVTVIPNGINADDYRDADTEAFRRQFGLGSHPFILFMGRLNPIKGPDLLLRAFCNVHARYPAFHLVFAGPDGGMLSDLDNLAARHGIQNKVRFLGFVWGKDKSRACHAAELMVIPSRQEAMSIVVLEAGISGTPVLLTDQCGFDDIERIGGGRVVPATVEGLQEGLAGLLAAPERFPDMGRKIRRYVADTYTWDRTAHMHIELYRRLLGANPP